jgi:hypothetical protein
MRYLTLLCLFLACSLVVSAQEEEVLDIPTMAKGDIGKLPRSSDKRSYEIGRVIDDEVLIAVLEPKNGVFTPVGRFFFRDAETVKKYEKRENGQWLGIEITMPGSYKVVGRKTFFGETLPIIVKTPSKNK